MHKEICQEDCDQGRLLFSGQSDCMLITSQGLDNFDAKFSVAEVRQMWEYLGHWLEWKMGRNLIRDSINA